MKHLILLLTELYPNRMFSLKEEYRTDEVYNVNVEYHLHIESICYNKLFVSFQQLENYVYTLYEQDGFNKNPIKGNNNG